MLILPCKKAEYKAGGASTNHETTDLILEFEEPKKKITNGYFKYYRYTKYDGNENFNEELSF